VPGHISATHNVVGMERYGHSNDWAHSHTSTRTTGGVMPNSELAAVAVSEPHAASFKQRISQSRIP
jgi:glycine cleavage system aminomethyltransferase T